MAELAGDGWSPHGAQIQSRKPGWRGRLQVRAGPSFLFCQQGSPPEKAFIPQVGDQRFAVGRFAEIFIGQHHGFAQDFCVEPFRMSADFVDQCMRFIQQFKECDHTVGTIWRLAWTLQPARMEWGDRMIRRQGSRTFAAEDICRRPRAFRTDSARTVQSPLPVSTFDSRVGVLVPRHGKLRVCPSGVRHIPRIVRISPRPPESVNHAGASLSKKTFHFLLAVSIAEYRSVFEEIALFPGTFQTEDAPVIFVKAGVSLWSIRAATNRKRGLPPAGGGFEIAVGGRHHMRSST